MATTNTESSFPDRQSPRAPAHDYSLPGAYYVTTCLHDRRPLLKHAALRGILETTWQDLPQRFPGIVLDEFVIMPNHVHLSLWLTNDTKDGLTLSDIVGAYKSLTARAALSYLRGKGVVYDPPFCSAVLPIVCCAMTGKWSKNAYIYVIIPSRNISKSPGGRILRSRGWGGAGIQKNLTVERRAAQAPQPGNRAHSRPY